MIYHYCKPPYIEKSDISSLSLDRFLDKVGNGDLLLLSGSTKGEKSCKWATGSVFSHVGFLFREVNPDGNNIVYIWEADVGQGSRNGPRVMALEDKLARYHGHKVLGWRQLSGPRPSLKEILKLVPKYSKKTLDTEMWSWVLNGFVKDDKKVFCSELTAMTLQDLKILDSKELPCGYSPQNFHEKLRGLKSQYNYSKTIFIRF